MTTSKKVAGQEEVVRPLPLPSTGRQEMLHVVVRQFKTTIKLKQLQFVVIWRMLPHAGGIFCCSTSTQTWQRTLFASVRIAVVILVERWWCVSDLRSECVRDLSLECVPSDDLCSQL